MAEYRLALLRTDQHEGTWADDVDDPGGETYRGISRVFHPGWAGWALIDAHKGLPHFPEILETLPELDLLVVQFYKGRFWDCYRADEIPSQAIAEELYDTGVNLGQDDAVEILQLNLNDFNNRGRRWPDVKVDGAIARSGDSETLTTLLRVLAMPDVATVDGPKSWESILYNGMNVDQGAGYKARMRAIEKKEKYALGWFGRVQSFREWQAEFSARREAA